MQRAKSEYAIQTVTNALRVLEAFETDEQLGVTDLARRLGMQDVEVGDEAFDRDFVIKGNDEYKLRRLFANTHIRALLEAQPEVSFTSEPPWSFTREDDEVDELSFTVSGVPKDVARLKGLFDLFAETLDELSTQGRR